MAKASFATKDAVEGGFHVQEGSVEVIDARVKVIQYRRKTGDVAGDPFPAVQLDFARLDKEGNRVEGEDPITEDFSIGKLEKFHPGKASSADDEDPEDMGAEEDAEGNCIFVAEEGAKLNKQSKWIRLVSSLEKCGFRPEVLGNGYIPDLIGLKGHVHTETGTKLPGSTSEKDPTYLIFDKITVYPYEKKASAKGAAKGGGKAPAKSNGKASAPAPAKEAAAAGGDDDTALVKEHLTAIAAELSGTEGVDRKKIQTNFQTRLMRAKVPAKQHKGLLDMLKDDDTLTNLCGELAEDGVMILVDLEAGTVSFPAE